MPEFRLAGRFAISRRALALLAAGVLLAGGAGIAQAKPEDSGFHTKTKPMLEAVANGGSVRALITVGDSLANGYMFRAIPDGIAIDPRGHDGAYDIYVNHETSLVPFPATLTDFDNAMLSKLTLKKDAGKIVDASFAIPASANYQRFCSNFMIGPDYGSEDYIVLTNEETSEFFNRTGVAWPLAYGSDLDQGGLVATYDVDSDTYTSIPGMGRLNHENSMGVPGYDDIVVITGDDTFSSNPPSSQLYMYVADDSEALLADEGTLYAFRVDGDIDDSAPFGSEDYYDVAASDAALTGEFVAVPQAVAQGNQADLESWSDANGIFQFIRVEDTAHDRNDPYTIYIADTGRGSGAAPNGRIYTLRLNPLDPTEILAFDILADGDAAGLQTPGVIHQPDNLETTPWSLFVQEDPSGGNQFPAGSSDPNATTARIWRYDFATSTWSVAAKVDQALDPAANLGNWESSGIVDASAIFGPHSFLVTVQAHSLFVDTEPYALAPGVTMKEEGGQLLLLRIPGA